MSEEIKKGITFYLIGQIISGVFLLGFNISAARLLGPEQYGILSVFYALLLTVSTLMSGGMRDGMVKYISSYQGERREIGGILREGFFFLLITYTIVFLIFLLGSRYFSGRFFNGSMKIIYFFIIGVFLLSGWTYGLSILEGIRDFSDVAISRSVVYIFMFGIFLLWGGITKPHKVYYGIYAIIFSLMHYKVEKMQKNLQRKL